MNDLALPYPTPTPTPTPAPTTRASVGPSSGGFHHHRMLTFLNFPHLKPLQTLLCSKQKLTLTLTPKQPNQVFDVKGAGDTDTELVFDVKAYLPLTLTLSRLAP